MSIAASGQHSIQFDNERDSHILSVGELTSHIKAILEDDDRLADVWVRGELSNLKRHTSGHVYFTLKDAEAQLRCVMFRREAQRLKFDPDDGGRVQCRGYVGVFEKQGQYQLYVQEMRYDGVGSLFEAFERLKKKLAAEGLFDASRKKPLPRFPQTIGICTSMTGAAIRDLISIIRRRSPGTKILAFPALVQGPDAPASIVRAIRLANGRGDMDVLIVGRGGGSIEDLWAFNDERVARAAFASRIPIVSAVGHETDFTILDFVADLRASTPSAAAELVVPHRDELRAQLNHFMIRMKRALNTRSQLARQQLRALLASRVLVRPNEIVLQRRQALDELWESSHRAILDGMSLRRQSLVARDHQLAALDPRSVLRRGYSIFQMPDGTVIASVRDAIPHSFADVVLRDGRVKTQIHEVTEEAV